MAKAAGFELFDQQNSDFIDGSSSSDISLADWLPYWAVSGWYFAFHRAR
jgi:hypothetical protein